MTCYDLKISYEGYDTETGKGLHTTSLCLSFTSTDSACPRLKKCLFFD